MIAYRNRRSGVAAPTYALVLGLVALAGVAGLAAVGSQQGKLSGEVAGALGAEGNGSQAGGGGAETPSAPEREVFFREDFRDPKSFQAWDDTKGQLWQVVDGELVNGTKPGNKPTQQTFVPGGPWEDQSVTVNATMESGWGYGIYLRSTQGKNGKPTGVCFQVDPGYRPGAFLFREVNNGRETRAKAVTWAPDFDWYGESHEIRVEARGDTFTAYVDGRKVAEHRTKKYSQGTAGLRTWGHGSGKVRFHDVEVAAPKARVGGDHA